MRLDTEKLSDASAQLSNFIKYAQICESLDSLIGIEGEAARIYFSVFDCLILQQKRRVFQV